MSKLKPIIKTKVIYTFFVMVLISQMGYSQMTLAKRVPPTVSEKIKIEKSAETVWNYLLKFDNFSEFGSSIISKSTTKGFGLNALREVTFKDGHIRNEELVYIDERFKRMSVEVLNPDKVITTKYFCIFKVKAAKKNNCIVSLNTHTSFSNKHSKIKDKIAREFKSLLKGLKNHLEN